MSFEKRNNDIVVVTGVSASGKDYLLKRAREQFADRIQVVSLGALIHADMRRRHPGVYDASDSLKKATMEDLRVSAHNATDELIAAEDPTVVNGHVAYRRQESVVVDTDMNMRLNPRDYVFIEADPDEILHRRITNERDRVIESVDIIHIQQEIARVAVAALASRMGARVNNVINDNEVERNAGLIADVVNGR